MYIFPCFLLLCIYMYMYMYIIRIYGVIQVSHMYMCICYTLFLWLLIYQTHERARQGRLRARFMRDIRYMHAHSLSGTHTRILYTHSLSRFLTHHN